MSKLRLSEASTKMFHFIKKEMESYKKTTINIPFLIYGTLNVAETSSDWSILSEYLELNEIEGSSIEDAISSMICASTANDDSSKKAHPNEQILPKDFVNFVNYDGTDLHLKVDNEVYEVINNLFKLINRYKIEEIKPAHFVIAMFMADNKELKHFFRKIEFDYKEAKFHFSPKNHLKLLAIPQNLSDFLNLINPKIDISKPCTILKREKETEQLWNIMLKKTKRNAVIIGEAGVGKTALIEKLTYEICKGTCPKEFLGFNVISLDVNALISGTTFRGQAEERIDSLIKFLETSNNIILFIDEVHTMLGAGSCFEGEMDLSNAMKPILARGDTIVIGATTLDEYEKYFKSDSALSRRFEKVTVKEPLSKYVYPMIKEKIQDLSEYHKVTISKKMSEFAIMIASCFAFEKKNPDKSLDLIDKSMVIAKRAGKKKVDKISILKNFNIYFELWENMTEEQKLIIAYHEIGHYLFGKMSGRLTDYNWLAVSIMPAETYYGVTVYEIDYEKTAFLDLNYYIDLIAFGLAGRIGEGIFTKTLTAGASQDLLINQKLALHVVTKLAILENDNNCIFINTSEYPMFSENVINHINKKVEELFTKANQRVIDTIEEYDDIFQALVKAIMKNHIMSEAELDKVIQNTLSNRKT